MRVNRLKVRGIEDLLLATGGNREFRPVQLGPREVRGELATATVDELTLTYGEFRSDIHVSGTMSNEKLTMGFLLGAEGITLFGKRAHPGDMVVVGKGRENDARYRGQLEYVAINANKSDVSGIAEAHGWKLPPGLLDGANVWRIGNRKTARLRARVEPVAERLRCGVLQAIEPEAERTLAAFLLLEFTRGMAGEVPRPAVEEPPGRAPAKLVQRTEEWLEGDPDRQRGIREISRHLEVSERQLFRAFRAEVGMSPAKYLKRYRMTQARLELLAADPAETTVTRVAVSWGFWELGRFAVEYRRLFGERPSETLQSCVSGYALRGARRSRMRRRRKVRRIRGD